jgi:hyperosmotically inducible protein
MRNKIFITSKRRDFEKISVMKVLSFLLVMMVLCSCAPFMGRETTGEYIDDVGVTSSVKNKIFQDPTLKPFQIHVETFQNTVQLSGFVDSRVESQRAEQLARSVDGVQAVKNNLVVRNRRR